MRKVAEIIRAVLGISALPALAGFYFTSSPRWAFAFAVYLILVLVCVFTLGKLLDQESNE
jgi:hypothetical protein